MFSRNKRPVRSFFRSFWYAAAGLAACLRERNFRFHVVAAVYVPILGRHFLQSAGEWCALILTIALVLAAEAVNTAVERLVDLVCPQRDERAKIAKDAAAGGVLVCAVAAVAVACVLFGRWEAWSALFALWREQWWRPLLLGASLVPSLYFVFHK